ncbi:DivIVA domain-containing protein, partial [Cryobacterium sp. MLB-32]|uniref:DivIVA domain-containing protein n=2 Tax=Cryobacterium sp. MLB-32 TaxID=1529318 RepID=UPI000562D31E
MPNDESDFTQVFRGYDKDEVAKALQGLRRDLIKANTHSAESSKEVRRLSAQIDELNAIIEEVGSPTFSG